MLAALKWIKYLAVAGMLVTIAVLALLLTNSNAQITALNTQLAQAVSDNQTNLKTIETLKDNAQSTNQLLVQRQLRHQQQQRELTDEIKTLRTKMATVDCVIPADVTARLRKPY
ncbi:hypothetical protein [Vibrio quintilis]|uniref:DUF2570 domain-containing protein n=2 Tax=Vibrio quintilis TaxID=1117707 RepID=A0A1M7YZ95_9VIBR|nr:hypothetical protein [Vibrio quintilis]SHO57893.1 hypothetical protein VQ7734_03663 [Vibrio quintilis]